MRHISIVNNNFLSNQRLQFTSKMKNKKFVSISSYIWQTLGKEPGAIDILFHYYFCQFEVNSLSSFKLGIKWLCSLSTSANPYGKTIVSNTYLKRNSGMFGLRIRGCRSS